MLASLVEVSPSIYSQEQARCQATPASSPLGRGDKDASRFPVDLVFIYLSITLFLPVLVLTRCSLLPPTLHSSTCHDPRSPGAVPLLQGTLWSQNQEGQATGKITPGRGNWQDVTLSRDQGVGPWVPDP